MFGFYFSYLISIYGTAVGWFKPFNGVMVYWFLAILRPERLWFWSFQGGHSLSQLVAISTLIGWVLSGDVLELRRLASFKWPIIGYVIFLLVGVLSWLFWAISATTAWGELDILLKTALMGLVTLTVIRDEKQVKIFALVITGSLSYVAWVMNVAWTFDGVNRMQFGLHGDNNNTALVMVVGVPMAFFAGILTKNIILKGVWFLAAILMTHAVLFSFSRGGMVGLGIVVVIIFTVAVFLLPRKGLTVALTVILLLLSFRLAGNEVRQRFSTIFASDDGSRESSAQSRLGLWAAAWENMKKRPMGVGPECFPLIIDQYGFKKGKLVHSVYLQIGADYGFIGLFGFLLFYFGSFIRLFGLTLNRTAKVMVWPQYFGIMTCTGLFGYLTCATFLSAGRIEVGFIVALLGLCTTRFVVERREQYTMKPLPELEQVPEPGTEYDVALA